MKNIIERQIKSRETLVWVSWGEFKSSDDFLKNNKPPFLDEIYEGLVFELRGIELEVVVSPSDMEVSDNNWMSGFEMMFQIKGTDFSFPYGEFFERFIIQEMVKDAINRKDGEEFKIKPKN